MISTKVKVLAVLLLVLVCIDQSEGKFWRKIKRPFVKVGKEVGRVGSQIGKETRRGVSNVGKVGRKVIKKLAKGPLNAMSKLTDPFISRLLKRKEGKAEVEEAQFITDVNAPPNEAFDVKLLRLHNEIRRESKSEPALKWDTLLAKTAQEWADECSTGYKVFEDSREETYGQNIYPLKEATVDAYNAVQMWKSFSHSHITDTFECQENQDCYPYLQMIWPNTKYVGCGVSQCEHMQDLQAAGSVLVCFYTPL